MAMLPPPTSKVELKIKCRNLANRDVGSYSDPQVFLFLEDAKTGKWSKEPHAMTELIKDSLNPSFVKGLQIDYRFESVQRLKFVVYDIDCKHSTKWSDQDFLGEVTTDLGSIIGSKGGQQALYLAHPKRKGQNLGIIVIRAEELSSSKRVLNFSIRANDLTKKGMFKSAPSSFIVIQRGNNDGTFTPVYKSDVVPQHDDPVWKPFSVKESVLCNGDPNRPLRIEVMSHKASGTHVLLGATAPFTAAELAHCRFPHAMAIPPMTGSSMLMIQGFHVTEPPSFLDFLAGGGTLGLTVAIDFTQSNGDPRQPTSLHFKSPSGENDYSRAIRSVGNILQCYDSDKRFPMFGYGGRLGGQVSHCFPLNGNTANPEVHGVDGMLQAYWHALTFAELYGPTNFAPVIKEATNIAKQMESLAGGYSILLIITDGAITDMNETVKAIRKGSNHPLSIIIIGVGHAHFTSMDILDGDDESGFKKGRDIVQFVAARNFLPHNEYGFAQALLAEVPDQFMAYMTLHGIKPRPPIRIETVAAMPMPLITGVPVGAAMPVPVAVSPVGSPLQPYGAVASVPPHHGSPNLAPYGAYPGSRPSSPGPGQLALPPPGPPSQYGQYAAPATPLAGQYPAPTGQYAPPAGQYPPPGAPPAGQYASPAAPPTAQYAPPGAPPAAPVAGQYAPPAGPPPPSSIPEAIAAATAVSTAVATAGSTAPPSTSAPPAQGYPPQPYYPQQQQQQQYPGYPPQQSPYPGYPPQQGAYPGYPPQPYGYPPQQGAYPGYPPQPYPGYPPQQHQQQQQQQQQQAGYPPQQPGYPPQQPGYAVPQQQPGYPSAADAAASSVQPSTYPPPESGYPAPEAAAHPPAQALAVPPTSVGVKSNETTAAGTGPTEQLAASVEAMNISSRPPQSGGAPQAVEGAGAKA
ncbi:hypothetical protein BGZ83_006698 [Gryganskiella cystojenkinii]|nr:hypothetical protein BGZ83_006698 [Gryganskiella cystojenkinii]